VSKKQQRNRSYEATGYSYLKRWNSKGYEGLIPEFGGGRPMN